MTTPAGRLHRRAAEAGAALGAAGVTLNVLDGSRTAACLARALDPAGTTRLPAWPALLATTPTSPSPSPTHR